jgi:hypothetical protein
MTMARQARKPKIKKKNPENPVNLCPKDDYKYAITQTIFTKDGNDYREVIMTYPVFKTDNDTFLNFKNGVKIQWC